MPAAPPETHTSTFMGEVVLLRMTLERLWLLGMLFVTRIESYGRFTTLRVGEALRRYVPSGWREPVLSST